MRIGTNIKKFVNDFKFFDWIKKSELVELDKVNCKDDPVRPELDNDLELHMVERYMVLNFKMKLKV